LGDVAERYRCNINGLTSTKNHVLGCLLFCMLGMGWRSVPIARRG